MNNYNKSLARMRKLSLAGGLARAALMRDGKLGLANRFSARGEVSQEALEFAKAMEDWRKRTGIRFPSCSEVLDVLKSLGYRKILADDPVVIHKEDGNEDFMA